MSEVMEHLPGNMEKPLVTVAMPIYNAGKYLRMAVLSIVKQTETNWELFIIDDGSTDNALDFIRDIHDPRIRILQDGANKGLAVRLNEAIDLAQGVYFARMDQDDVSYPERFARQLEMLRADPVLDLVATRAILIDENDRAVGVFPGALTHEDICAKPWRGFYFPHPSWMGKTSWFRKYRYMIPGPYFCEDQELLLRSYRNSRFATVDAELFGYRIRRKINWRKAFKTRNAVWEVQLRHFKKTQEWGYLLRALMVTVGRLAGDSAKLFMQIVFGPRHLDLTTSQTGQWEVVLRMVSDSRAGLTYNAAQAEKNRASG